MLERFSATLILAGTALVVLVILAGVISVMRRYGWTDRIVTFLGLVGTSAISTPSFFLGLLLILLFAVEFRLFQASGM